MPYGITGCYTRLEPVAVIVFRGTRYQENNICLRSAVGGSSPPTADLKHPMPYGIDSNDV
jgi:hypothetical protein